MKKAILTLGLVLAFSLAMLAQAAPSESKSKSGKKAAAAAGATTTSISGCLSGPNDEGAYVLKNGRYRKGVEVGGSDNLKAHVGHKVKLTGTWAKSGTEIGEKPEKTEEKMEKAAGMERHFKVQKIDMIADTCTVPEAKSKSKASTK